MFTLDELRNNATLTEEEFQLIRDRILTAVRDRLVARQFMSVRQVPATTQEYGYDRVKTEFADAVVVGKGADFPRDQYDTERIKLPILKIGDGFTIPREDYLARQYRTQSLEQMTRRLAEKEDKLIFTGDASFLPNGGALDFAGNTQDAGASPAWDTASPSTIYSDIISAASLLEADKFGGPYTFVVHANELKNLRKFNSTDQTTVMSLLFGDGEDMAGAAARGVISRMLVSYGITDGNALLLQEGADIAELVVAEDLTVEEPAYVARQQRFEGNVYERLIPVFYQYGATAGQSEAICKIIDL